MATRLSVCLYVCLSVCLSVCPQDNRGVTHFAEGEPPKALWVFLSSEMDLALMERLVVAGLNWPEGWLIGERGRTTSLTKEEALKVKEWWQGVMVAEGLPHMEVVIVVQLAGEILSVPDGWTHTVLTCPPCLEVAGEHLEMAHAYVIEHAAQLPELRHPDEDYMETLASFVAYVEN